MTDDAFRFGGYIETSGSKGTVERISIRSVSLRNPRGAVATVPYGQIVTLLIRGKFMARAGKQFGIKKAVLAAVQKAFVENGIKAVAKPITATNE